MPRGKPAQIGDRMTSQNGYHYIRTDRGWRLEHHVIAEQKFEREIDSEVETVFFVDGDRDNLDPTNISLRAKKGGSKAARIAHIETRIEELQAELEALEAS